MVEKRIVREVMVAPLEAAAGAIFFWSPGVVLRAIRGQDFSGLDMVVVTIVSPAIALLGLEIVSRYRRGVGSRIAVSLMMIVGIWVLGPLFMFAAASFTGGGFAQESALVDLFSLTVLFPVTTASMSVYDGTAAALLIACASLPVSGFRELYGRARPA